MGTSQSSKGPGSGIPMIPPWVAPVVVEEPGADPTAPIAVPPPPVVATPVAPSARFNGARRSLGSFASGGDANLLHRGVAHYVRTGYGGAATTARRFGGTISGGSALYDALTTLGSGSGIAAPGLDPAVLRGQSAEQIMDAVVEASHPIDGTLDREASRASSREALADLLTKHPDADLMALTEEQKLAAVETYVAFDVFHRLDLDIGQTVRDRAPTVTSAMSRLTEVKEYVRETVAHAFRALREAGRPLTRQSMSRIITAALKETFTVFESYLK